MNITIACALRWGVSLIEVLPTRRGSPYIETVQVQDKHRRMVLIQGRNCEESRIMALIIIL